MLYQNRYFRASVLLLVYSVLSGFSIWVAYQLRFDFFVDKIPVELAFYEKIPMVLLWVIPLKLLALMLFQQYSGLLSYFGTPDLYRLAKAVVVGSAFVGIVRVQSESFLVPPRGVILIDFVMFFVLLTGFRTCCRILREMFTRPQAGAGRLKAYRIVIIGAGDVGAGLAKEMLNRRGLGRVPVAFLDDDLTKINTRIHNVPVVGDLDRLGELKEKFGFEEAVIAMPGAPAKRIGAVVKMLQQNHLKFVTVPSLDQMATGKVRISQLRPVEIQDLLGRVPVEIEVDSIREMVENRVIMVTGAGGSIGSELCRQIVAFNPSRLLMVEQSEYLLFEIEQQLLETGSAGILLPLVGNILDKGRMQQIFSRFQPEIVFHAAALKHVPMMESQPGEAIKVNALGTAVVADLSIEHGVKRFVMISTDKAINPTSVMGATKRLAEMYVQSRAMTEEKVGTKLMAVRFGNVLGSSGSVIPTFKRQIAAGGPVRVTHPDVTRYFMTIPEAVGLVLQCGCQGDGGEIFVLDMGEPVRITDLARELIQLSGLRPDEDIEIEYVGLRPGEKLFEELQHCGEDVRETGHPKIMCFVTKDENREDTKMVLENFRKAIQAGDGCDLKQLLREHVEEYRPFLGAR